ncbi:MAG: DNRLRE domain-containing protein [Phycisphaeraceae bacterium]|nr:DNRLRE domain-containing protein [Phycisphaeraceae bacterium]
MNLRVPSFVAAAVLVGSAAAATVDVYVYNLEFSINPPGGPVVDPVIAVGDTVRWVHLQGNHTTTSVVGSVEVWNAPISSSSPTFSHTFTHAGVFHYYCIPHGFDNGDGTAGGMAGIVTVLDAPFGACCLANGTCDLLTEAACIAAGGAFQGVGSACAAALCAAQPMTVEFQASQDNILYESATGSVSNALGQYLYAGNQNNGAKRRPVVRFDTSSIPAGATVQSAAMTLFCNQSQGAATAVTAHRLLASWGEGTSQAGGNESSGAAATVGDATWLHRFFATTFWSSPGGDFVGAASASTVIAASNSSYTWSGAAVVADVQHWVDMPDTNHGWILFGDEGSSSNTKRFQSRQGAAVATRPKLTVTYMPPSPTGACCFSDGGCESTTEHDCMMAGGVFHGAGSECASVACAVVLEPFLVELPRPGVATPVSGVPGGAAHYEIAMTEQMQQLHPSLPPTRVWGYAGSYPGPTIEAFRGEPVTVIWKNDLRAWETGQLRSTHALAVDTCLHGPDMTGEVPVAVVHLHGGKVAHDSDGYPEYAFPPGSQSPLYHYPNDQPAATLWYHDHALGITRLNVVMGMAGFYLLRDAEESALGLPSGEFEIPMAIQDRSFRADGSIDYPEHWQGHFFGNTILVNGKVWPYLEVKRGKYRFRLLNGSTSRAYTLALSDRSPFWQIGSDLGLLEAPVQLSEVTILPGERADMIFDFASYDSGTEVVLLNSAPAPYPGFPGVGVVPNVMKFIVGPERGHTAPLPGFLVPVPRIDPGSAVRERVLDLAVMPGSKCPGHHEGMWMIDGRHWGEITEFPVMGTTEIWTWRNDSGVSHPMHMHLEPTQVLNRQAIDPVSGEPTGPLIPPAPNEMGWKDTVDAWPGYFTRVIVHFDQYLGLFPYHCHILEHEDHEMMRQFKVVHPGDLNVDGFVNGVDLAILLGQWGACADCTADINRDGDVNGADLAILLGGWTG